MAIWGRLKQELDRASRAAQGAIDEGRVRLEIFRARQRADRGAQTLGYAVHRARKEERELSAAEIDRLGAEITNAEQEISRLESQLSDLKRSSTGESQPAANPPTANPPATV